jgi:hypothetical protein
MLLRKIVFSGFFSILFGFIASEFSFDFENYSLYADRIDAASERFSTEPAFPLFLFVLSFLDLSSNLIIQIFMTAGSFIIIYSLTTLANKNDSFGIIRSIFAIVLASPLIIFSVIVPRQALAIGIIMFAVTIVNRSGRIFDWKIVFLFFLAAMCHNITALLGATIILIGYLNIRITITPLIFVVSIVFFGLEIFYPVSLLSLAFGYEHYINNMRETGFWRLNLFALVTLIYLMFASRRVGGVFAATASRNMAVALFVSLAIILLYYFVATDAIRLTYLISIMMISEIVRRISLL